MASTCSSNRILESRRTQTSFTCAFALSWTPEYVINDARAPAFLHSKIHPLLKMNCRSEVLKQQIMHPGCCIMFNLLTEPVLLFLLHDNMQPSKCQMPPSIHLLKYWLKLRKLGIHQQLKISVPQSYELDLYLSFTIARIYCIM